MDEEYCHQHDKKEKQLIEIIDLMSEIPSVQLLTDVKALCLATLIFRMCK